MSATISRHEHEIDDRLVAVGMFAWFRPMFTLAFRHWPITVAAGVGALFVEALIRRLPWPYFERWWLTLLHSLIETIAITLVVVVAYRFLAEKEVVGTVNDWPQTLSRGVQVAIVWVIVTALVGGVLLLIGATLGKVFGDAISGMGGAFFALALIVIGIPLLVFLFMPVWVSLGVAGALSTAYAVRSLENGLGAVGAALGLAFAQKWRVFWPSYALGLLIIALYFLFTFFGRTSYSADVWIRDIATFVSTALGVAMTFVIERAYATHLTMAEDGSAPEPQSGASTPPSPRGQAPASPAQPLPPGAPELAALLDQDLRANRTQRIVETVERGLAADAKFFVGYPDATLGLAKRLAQVERPDLALRLLQHYLKEHRGHRQHLTCALLVGNLLLRDSRRLPDAARFLEQVRLLYPNEPMVHQLIKMANKAIAETGAAGES